EMLFQPCRSPGRPMKDWLLRTPRRDVLHRPACGACFSAVVQVAGPGLRCYVRVTTTVTKSDARSEIRRPERETAFDAGYDRGGLAAAQGRERPWATRARGLRLRLNRPTAAGGGGSSKPQSSATSATRRSCACAASPATCLAWRSTPRPSGSTPAAPSRTGLACG